MSVKLSNTELVVMNVIWCQAPVRAIKIADIVCEQTGWKKNTVYTLINRLIVKGALERSDPGFLCTALIDKSETCIKEAKSFIGRMYNGSINTFVSAFLENNEMDKDEFEKLQELINNADPKFKK